MQTAASAAVASAHGHLPIDEEWLGRRVEDILEPGLPIIDPHHHMWDRARSPRYMLDDLLRDMSGQRVLGSVFVECHSAYRAQGPAHLRSVGETEFANGMAALCATGDYGPLRACAGIVASVDLRDAAVMAALQAHRAVAGERFKGIRQIAARTGSPDVRVRGPVPPAGLLADTGFRRGFAQLSQAGLSFDAWVYHPQLDEVADLAHAFPDTVIVLDHSGGPIGIGPYRGRREQGYAEWREGMRRLSRHRNVFVKLGGFGMRVGGFGFNMQPMPPSSAQLAEAWSPYIDACIEDFGTKRCMFESNFPVDKACYSYTTLWNAFKRMTASFSAEERADLFWRTAAGAYKLATLTRSIQDQPASKIGP